MSIYVTGDIHGSLSIEKLSFKNWPHGRDLTRDDYLVILGDFGLVWSPMGMDRQERYWLNWLNNRPWTTLFIDGNHENFDRLCSGEFTEKAWHGGRVHEIRPNVLHLMRGYVFDLDGVSALAFGGARSIDRALREPGVSWWSQEIPSDAEKARCVESLAKVSNDVDIVLTHDAPAEAWDTVLSGQPYDPDPLSWWLQTNIADKATYRRWCFGHHHVDVSEDGLYRAMFHGIEEIDL